MSSPIQIDIRIREVAAINDFHSLIRKYSNSGEFLGFESEDRQEKIRQELEGKIMLLVDITDVTNQKIRRFKTPKKTPQDRDWLFLSVMEIAKQVIKSYIRNVIPVRD